MSSNQDEKEQAASARPSPPVATTDHRKKKCKIFSTTTASWVSALGSLILLCFVAYQAQLTRIAMREGTDQFYKTIEEIRKQSDTFSEILIEQQRSRLSFSIDIERIETGDQSNYRFYFPLQIGGTTEARNVRYMTYSNYAPSFQRQYIDSVEVDWLQRTVNKIGDVSPTEQGKRLESAALTLEQISANISSEQSLYVVGRLEYCDIFGDCRFFMRCVEVRSVFESVTNCGTQIGDLR